MSAKHWALWLDWTTHKGRGSCRRVSLWAQWCPVDTVVSHGVLCGVAVQPFQEGLRSGTREISMWKGWAERCIHAWNLCLDAAALCGYPAGTPAYMLCDILEDRDINPELRQQLRWHFLLGAPGGPGNAAYPICVPEMPAIPGESSCIIV